MARCGKKRRCGQRACQEGRSERGHHEHIGKRGITEPYLPYLLPRYHGCHGPGRQRYQCALRNTGRPLPPPSRFYKELARATGDGALPPERDMKQLAQVHPVPSRNHNRHQAPSQVLLYLLSSIHHRACLPYPTSYLLGTLPLPNLSPRTHEMRTSPRFRLHRRRSHRCLVNVDAQPRTGH